MTPATRQLIFVWPYVEWGGAQIYCLAIIKLAKFDWDITVILPRNSRPDLIALLQDQGVRLEFMGAAVDLQPAPTLVRKLRRQRARIEAEFETYRRLRKHSLRNSVIHIDFAPWQSWIFFSALILNGGKIFVTLHNALQKQPRWRELIFRSRLRFLSKLPGFHIFASNHDTRNKLKDWVSSTFWEKVPVTYTCVDRVAVESISQEPFDRDQYRRKFDIPRDKYLVLTVGQFVDRKGRWVLLDAARKAAQIDDDLIFIWVTPSMPSKDDCDRIDEYRLGSKFRLILSASLGGGRVDVLRFFKTADCFALPSFVEGLPIAVLEAMALGVPSISTNVFAIPEAVKHEETGLLIEAGDSDELCKAILRLKNDRSLSLKLQNEGSRFVLEHFDERVSAQIAVRAFEDSLEAR